MASTYSNLKIELIGTGEQTNTWGTTTNTNLGTAIEEAIAESADVSFSSANVTLTLTNSNSSQTARNVRLNLTGTSGGARTLTVPDIEKPYIINNGLADTVTVQNSTGSTVAVPAGKTMWVYSTGAGVTDVTTHATSMTLGSALPVASGGTGATSLTANNVILGNGTSAVQVVAPGTSGNVLVSDGTTWTSGTSSKYALQTTTITAGTGLSGGGDLSTNRTVAIASTGVTADTYGSSSAIPVITVNAQGQITSATTASAPSTTGSLGSSGWTRLPNGLTFAWGELNMSYTGSSNNGFYSLGGSASLPLTFSSVYQTQVSFKDGSGTFYGASVQVTSISTTSISVAGNTAYGSSSEPNTVSYFVIGTS